MSEDYLELAEARMAELQRRYMSEVPFSARPLFDEILGELAVALWQLRLAREDAAREARVGERERMTAVEREVYFEAMVQNAPDMVTVLDADGCVRFESRGVELQLGWTQDELVGRNAFELIHPGDQARVAGAMELGRTGPPVSFTVRYRFRQRDGAWRPLESVARYVADSGWFVVHSRAAGGPVRE